MSWKQGSEFLVIRRKITDGRRESRAYAELRFGLGLLGVAVGLAVSINGLRPHPLPWRYQIKAERMPIGADITVSLAELRSLLQAQAVLLVDARPRLFFELGHVPRAWSLPREEFAAAYARLASRLREEGRAVVVYCESESCEDAETVRMALGMPGCGATAPEASSCTPRLLTE